MIKVPETLNPTIRKAMNASGGIDKSIGIAKKVGTPNMKEVKANDDLLTRLYAVEDPDFDKYMQEKSAGVPIRPNPMYRIGAGAVGAVAGYSAARNDGQSTLGSLGMAGLTGATGAILGHQAGKAVARYGAEAAGKASVHGFTGAREGLKSKIKMLSNPEERASAFIENKKSKLFQKGNNFLETGKNMLTGGIAHAQDAMYHLGGTKMTNVDRARTFHNFDNSFKGFNQNLINEGGAALGQFRSSNQASAVHGQLKKQGVNLEKLHADIKLQGGDPTQILNSGKHLSDPKFVKAMKNQGMGRGSWNPTTWNNYTPGRRGPAPEQLSVGPVRTPMPQRPRNLNY